MRTHHYRRGIQGQHPGDRSQGVAWVSLLFTEPPPPTFFVRRELYERYGLFHTDYRIAADYELAARFLARHKVRYAYLPEVIVKMRVGGASTRGLRSTLNREILRACTEDGIPTNILKVKHHNCWTGGLFVVILCHEE